MEYKNLPSRRGRVHICRTGRKTKSKAILSHFPNHHAKPVASANMIHIFSSLCVSEKSTPFPSTTISTHTHSFYPLRRLHDNKIFIFLKWVKSIKKYKCRIPPNLCSLTEYFQYKTCRFLHKYLIPHYGSTELWRWEEKCSLPRRHNSNRCTISVIKDYTKLMIKNVEHKTSSKSSFLMSTRVVEFSTRRTSCVREWVSSSRDVTRFLHPSMPPSTFCTTSTASRMFANISHDIKNHSMSRWTCFDIKYEI